MTQDFAAEPNGWHPDRPAPRGWDEPPASRTQGPTLASGLPEWDLLPPTEFVQRPRGRL